MTMVIIAAEIDLSVASVLGLSSAVMGVPVEPQPSRSRRSSRSASWSARCAAPFNGLLVTRLGLPSLAVTIGTLALYRGLAFVVSATSR